MPNLVGINPIREALLSSRDDLETIFMVSNPSHPRLKEIRRLARSRGIPVHIVPGDALRRLAEGTHHQGVVARVGEFHYCSYEEILEEAAKPGLILVLDGVQDPQNLGAILRTAEGAGVSGVFLPMRRAAHITAAVVQASAGAISHLKVSRQKNLSNLLDRLHRDEFWIIGLEASADILWTFPDFTLPTVLVLGGEGRGIRTLVRAHCDSLVGIPMWGRVASLNVSVSAGIILYEVRRQRIAQAAD